MATKLGIFNGALSEMGIRDMVDTGEIGDAGSTLNARYTRTVRDCLTRGSWNFAMETIKAEADTGVVPEFGFAEVFAKPSDWMRTHGISSDEYINIPLFKFYDDASFWSADVTPIYIRYVSDDTGLGFELTRWPDAFTRFVELELAARSGKRLGLNKADLDTLKTDRNDARTTALNQDAMNEANPKFPPPGKWTTSRGGRTGRSDRGSRTNLIG